MTEPIAGYTLPVFTCAAAVAALSWLRQNVSSLSTVSINLLEPREIVDAYLNAKRALVGVRKEFGKDLDAAQVLNISPLAFSSAALSIAFVRFGFVV